MMIYGLIPQELHSQLLDHQNYQNRTNGVEELKNILLDLDLNQVPSDSIVEFIHFLRKLLDDNNFKVLYGTLQVINLLIEKLDYNVDRYYKEIVSVTMKTLGDSRNVTRHEYMHVFRQLMRILGPQRVLDLLIGQLRHKNSRVREDVINIITAGMLTHPRKDFNIPSLCFEVAPYLADSKKKVRHAALELFAVFDYCLDTGKKQPLMKAIDRVELTGEAEGLMAAVQARRARHMLPRLSADGTVEYALILPKPGQRRLPEFGSGADLDWVLNGGRVNSSRSLQMSRDSDQMSGSLASLTDDLPQRRIVSAGKGRNKLPWEKSAISSCAERQTCTASNGKSRDQVCGEDLSAAVRLSQNSSAKLGSSSPLQLQSPGRTRRSVARQRRSGSLDSDPDIFKTVNLSDSEKALPKTSRLLSGNPSVERTFSLPTNPTPPGSFLLPSYPLTALAGSLLTPTIPRRNHADSSLSMSNTWPNKRDISPHRRRNAAGEVSSSKCSPLPPRAARVNHSASSLRQSRNAARLSSPVSPRTPEQQKHTDRTLHLDLTPPNTHDPDEEPLDREEMLNSLRSLRNSAAKKRAKVSVSGSDPDPDSPDSAVKLELVPDSPDQTSPSVTSPLSESGLSSLCSPPTPSINGTKSSPLSSAVKTRAVRAPGKQSAAAGGVQQDSCLSDVCVSVVGQRLCSHRPSDPDEQKLRESTPPHIRAAGREPLRVFRTAKGSHSSQSCSARDVCEGVIGRGVFGSVVLPSRPGVTVSPDQSDSVNKPPRDPPSGVYGHAFTASHPDSDDAPEAEEPAERVKLSKFARDKMHQRRVEQQEAVEEPVKRHMTHMAADFDAGCVKDVMLNGSESLSESLSGPQQPVKSFSPTHQPTPPTDPPTRHAPPRLRRASSLNRTRPSASHCSDDLIPETPKKDPQDRAELRPVSKPELVLTQSVRLLSSDDWEKKIEGMNFIRSLTQFHPDVLSSRIHDVCLSLLQEVRNLRSGVSRVAVVTVGEMFAALQRGMDQELEALARALLHKAGESNAFIRQDVDKALDSMIQNCTVSRSLSALLTGGLGHLNSVVRKCMAQHLTALVEKVGAARLLSGTKDLTDRILPAVCKLAQDSSQEARYFGRRMLLFLSSHRDFDKMMEKFVPAKDLPAIRDAVFTLKTKGLGEMPQDAPSARGRRSLPGSGIVRTSSLTREPLLASRDSGSSVSKAAIHSFADKTEYIKQMKTLLNSKDFRERMRGIDQLVADCEENPSLVIGSMFPVFDALKARLQESNSKVNLRALEALQKIISVLKDSLAQVLNILIPAIVDNHLNSKNTAIYSAALGAVQALIDNIDNSLLLQPLCLKAQYLSGKAKLDLVDKVSELVTELHPRKPQLVEQKVLPVLWHLLGSSSNSGAAHGRSRNMKMATARLAEALHAHMGQTLLDCAASQTDNIQCDLNELLRTSP